MEFCFAHEYASLYAYSWISGSGWEVEDIHNAGNTIILVTHEEDIARHAHRIIRLHDGYIGSDEINPDIRKMAYYQDLPGE